MVSPDHVQFSAKSLSFLSSSQANLCACCVHIWPMHLLQQCWSCRKTLPLSISELFAVLCTLHTFDPACLLYLLFCCKIKWFQAFLNCCRLLNHDGVMKGGHWFVLLWDIWHKCEILGKSKNRRVSITLPGRLELLWNFSFVLLHCPNKCQFFFGWFARSTDVKKLSFVRFRPPLSWPEIGWTNVQTASLANPRAT